MICVHDLNLKDNTISILNHRFMALPQKIYGKCECCSKLFAYILNDNGLFVREEDDKDENK